MMSRILALDFGMQRIGLAISDETKTIAFPQVYISTENKQEILDIITREQIVEIILGLPISLDGQDTPMTKQVRDFAKWLEAESCIGVTFVDERFSSHGAMATLKTMNKRGQKAREMIDSLVAQQLLETHLKNVMEKNK